MAPGDYFQTLMKQKCKTSTRTLLSNGYVAHSFTFCSHTMNISSMFYVKIYCISALVRCSSVIYFFEQMETVDLKITKLWLPSWIYIFMYSTNYWLPFMSSTHLTEQCDSLKLFFFFFIVTMLISTCMHNTPRAFILTREMKMHRI